MSLIELCRRITLVAGDDHELSSIRIGTAQPPRLRKAPKWRLTYREPQSDQLSPSRSPDHLTAKTLSDCHSQWSSYEVNTIDSIVCTVRTPPWGVLKTTVRSRLHMNRETLKSIWLSKRGSSVIVTITGEEGERLFTRENHASHHQKSSHKSLSAHCFNLTGQTMATSRLSDHSETVL